MNIIYALVGSWIVILLLLFLWIKDRKKAQKEHIAYGLRSGDDSNENTKTNLTMLDARYRETLSRLEDLGEVIQDPQGQWIWGKSGKPVGEALSKKQ